ncbi:MAG: twin-arginine translocase TatA/TatE family subunit [Planctomycetota bacterium]|jgi:sec-independent protein translocase protein TatA
MAMAIATARFLAIIFPSGQEWIIILIVGIVLFGRRLPEVGKQVGRTIIQLRQGMQKLRDEIDLDEDLREVKESVIDVQHDLQESVDEPRVAMDPRRLLDDLTDEALSAPGPSEDEGESEGESER